MGIPAYFAYLVRNYPEIIKSYGRTEDVGYFYIDANSIVYDVIYKAIEGDANGIMPTYDVIIENTIKYLTELIVLVGASHMSYIAFDGVAPCAKMEQQRQRRARAVIDGKGITFITPGTPFMCKLNVSVYNAFRDVKGVVLSGADIPGEGEHKIFENIRQICAYTKQSRVLIYGLDADLIILALCHIKECGEVGLLREYNKVVDRLNGGGDGNGGGNDKVIVRINIFAEKIKDLGINVQDYIFMSFFLGNDFMPHFPALSIRKDGITKLTDMYKEVFGRTTGQSVFTDEATGQPLWTNVRRFIASLAKKEAEWFYFDYLERNKMEVRLMADPIALANIENTPMLNRALEKYVAPDYPNWEARYYKALFTLEEEGDKRLKGVVCNWVKGLEWVMRYYVGGVPDWNWKYEEHYPPLLVDIYKHMPIAIDGESFYQGVAINSPMKPQEQLAYVMPQSGDAIKLEWAYCRYFWESHVAIIQNKKND